MGQRDNKIDFDEADINVRFDSDSREAGRPITLQVHALSGEYSARAFVLAMSLDEAADIANNLLDAVAFAKRVRKGSGGDL